ncbi:mechanosensitive ion channel family protein [Marinobacterium jannaschii]|uniref:mechanosensitive ion channel family protein n=1 Tax=Marinobacterium jannaschii TaxID=64970 RepID=UPI000483EA1A|nr:mechanosensitive ion channel family protein [Marinobacterium jannaschii]
MFETDFVAFISDHKLIASLSLIAFTYLIKMKTTRLLKRWGKARGNDTRHLINIIKNLINLSLAVCLIIYWSSELQEFALSVAAFVVAFVIATREFIQCIIGFIYIVSSRPFQVGDWIQVGNHSGEVTETDWIKLTLLEVDIESYSHTGKTLFLPNNTLLFSTIKNLNFLKRYATHTFSITRDQSVNLFSIEAELLERATAHCQDFYDVADRYNSLIEKRLDVTISGPAPTIFISTSDIGRDRATITIFCPSDQALEIEQKITRDFMTLWHREKGKRKATKSAGDS